MAEQIAGRWNSALDAEGNGAELECRCKQDLRTARYTTGAGSAASHVDGKHRAGHKEGSLGKEGFHSRAVVTKRSTAGPMDLLLPSPGSHSCLRWGSSGHRPLCGRPAAPAGCSCSCARSATPRALLAAGVARRGGRTADGNHELGCWWSQGGNGNVIKGCCAE